MMKLHLPDDADSDEAAAIAAVVRRLIAEAQAQAAESDTERPRNKWQFSGRIDALQSRNVRPPTGTPKDDWAAAGRTDRF